MGKGLGFGKFLGRELGMAIGKKVRDDWGRQRKEYKRKQRVREKLEKSGWKF